MKERKIFVGVPAGQGLLCAETAHALFLEGQIAREMGIGYLTSINVTHSIVHLARNQIVAQFLSGDCTDFFFVDADVAWEPGKLIQLVLRDADVAGGCYRRKVDEEEYPVEFFPGDVARDGKTDLVEVDRLPGGFLHVKRHVFEEIQRQRPDLAYDDPYNENRENFMYFDFTREGRTIYGEDGSFCRLARSCGFKIWLEPQIVFDHIGRKRYTGSCGEWLLKRNGIK